MVGIEYYALWKRIDEEVYLIGQPPEEYKEKLEFVTSIPMDASAYHSEGIGCREIGKEELKKILEEKSIKPLKSEIKRMKKICRSL